MMELGFLSLSILTLGLGFGLTQIFLNYAIRQGLLDHPNDRSSHTQPTPRGGGVAIVVTFYLGMVCGVFSGILLPQTFWLALMGAPLIALLGWADDRWSLSASFRLAVQVVCAVGAVYWLALAYPASWLGVDLWLQVLLLFGWVVLVVWFTNFYNFMDGIDGIASVEAVSVFSAVAVFAFWAGDGELARISLLLVASCLGFAWFNWHPAKLFMGDVGSAFLGFLLAVLLLWGHLRGSLSLVTGLILSASFFADAALTLLVRILTGQKFMSAHRSHAYQKLTQRGWTHSQVALLYGLVNLFVLVPLASLAVRFPDWSLPLLILAWLPMLGLGLWLKAGRA